MIAMWLPCDLTMELIHFRMDCSELRQKGIKMPYYYEQTFTKHLKQFSHHILCYVTTCNMPKMHQAEFIPQLSVFFIFFLNNNPGNGRAKEFSVMSLKHSQVEHFSIHGEASFFDIDLFMC